MNTIVIYGFGGHARSVANSIDRDAYSNVFFVADGPDFGKNYSTYTILQSSPPYESDFFCAFSNPTSREECILNKKSLHHNLATIISNSSITSKSALISHGVFVGHGSYIGPHTSIGIGAIINTRAIIEHDCSIGNYTHISVNSTLAGSVKIGNQCFIGAGAVIKNGITITDNVKVGAGSVIVKDIMEPGIYVGNPGHFLKKIDPNFKL